MARPKIPARPTVYKGIQMRSRLEAGFAAWLDKWGFEWEYEPCCFAGPNGQYLPDFLIHNLSVIGQVGPVYVECKPQLSQDDLDAAMKRMRVILDNEPNAGLILVSPGMVIAGDYPAVMYANRGYSDWTPLMWTWNRTWNSGPAFALAQPITSRHAPLAAGYWEHKA